MSILISGLLVESPVKWSCRMGELHEKKRGTMEARYTVSVGDSITALELMEPEVFLSSPLLHKVVYPDACHTLWMNLPLQNINAMDSSVF